MKRNSELSPQDRAWAAINYPFMNGRVSPTGWTLAEALDVVGLTESAAPDVRARILHARGEQLLFADYSVDSMLLQTTRLFASNTATGVSKCEPPKLLTVLYSAHKVTLHGESRRSASSVCLYLWFTPSS